MSVQLKYWSKSTNLSRILENANHVGAKLSGVELEKSLCDFSQVGDLGLLVDELLQVVISKILQEKASKNQQQEQYNITYKTDSTVFPFLNYIHGCNLEHNPKELFRLWIIYTCTRLGMLCHRVILRDVDKPLKDTMVYLGFGMEYALKSKQIFTHTEITFTQYSFHYMYVLYVPGHRSQP